MPHLTAKPDAVKMLHKRIALCKNLLLSKFLYPGGARSHATSAGSERMWQRRPCIAARAWTVRRSGKSGVVVSLRAGHDEWGAQVWFRRELWAYPGVTRSHAACACSGGLWQRKRCTAACAWTAHDALGHCSRHSSCLQACSLVQSLLPLLCLLMRWILLCTATRH